MLLRATLVAAAAISDNGMMRFFALLLLLVLYMIIVAEFSPWTVPAANLLDVLCTFGLLIGLCTAGLSMEKISIELLSTLSFYTCLIVGIVVILTVVGALIKLYF